MRKGSKSVLEKIPQTADGAIPVQPYKLSITDSGRSLAEERQLKIKNQQILRDPVAIVKVRNSICG